MTVEETRIRQPWETLDDPSTMIREARMLERERQRERERERETTRISFHREDWESGTLR